MKNIKKRVWIVLKKYPATRSSDKNLIRAYGEEFHSRWPNTINIDQFLNFPNFETIRRSRQRYQAKWMYLPPVEVEEKRREQEFNYVDTFSNV